MAALAMLYGAPLAAWWSVATEEMKTMSPRSQVRISGMTRRERWCGPTAWVPRRYSTSVGSVSATDRPRLAWPALLTRIEIGPSSPETRSTISASASGSATEAWTAMARRPSASISATVSAAAASSLR